MGFLEKNYIVVLFYVLTKGVYRCIYTLYTLESKKKGIPMNIIISNASSVPIYEQIESQIKDMIVSGALAEGEMLPSMRFLAKELRISLITTKRAYEELERDGFIETRVGIGCFVKAKNEDFIREKLMCEIEELLENAVNKAGNCNLSLEELTEILSIIYQEHAK